MSRRLPAGLSLFVTSAGVNSFISAGKHTKSSQPLPVARTGAQPFILKVVLTGLLALVAKFKKKGGDNKYRPSLSCGTRVSIPRWVWACFSRVSVPLYG